MRRNWNDRITNEEISFTPGGSLKTWQDYTELESEKLVVRVSGTCWFRVESNYHFSWKGDKLSFSKRELYPFVDKTIIKIRDILLKRVTDGNALEENEWYIHKKFMDDTRPSHFSLSNWNLKRFITLLCVCYVCLAKYTGKSVPHNRQKWKIRFYLFGEQTRVVVTSRVQSLIKFVNSWIPSV